MSIETPERQITGPVLPLCIEDGCKELSRDGTWCEGHYAMWQDGSIVEYYLKRQPYVAESRRRDLARFNITPKQYDQMFLSQDGKCAICGEPPCSRRLSVDHNHRCCDGDFSCGACVRGLLCGSCNTRLGAIEAGQDGWLASALFYIGKYYSF